MNPPNTKPHVAIACGGTGGHLFPGLAVAEVLRDRGCDITLMISPKEVDQQAVKSARGMTIFTLPAVASGAGRLGKFLMASWRSYQACGKLFQEHPVHAVLAMGGFTGAAPILAGKRRKAATFLHESNAIPGRANRWLAYVADQAFVGFSSAANFLHRVPVAETGTPVRPQFKLSDAGTCRTALGLDPHRPVLLVMGGSQGASGINELVTKALPLLKEQFKTWQYLHLTGNGAEEKIKATYAELGLTAVIHPFMAEMDLALGAATVAISRAGASSLAEMAAIRLPAVLIPYPFAMDNHQFYNAIALVKTGAARMLEQKMATPELLLAMLEQLSEESPFRSRMRQSLSQWHAPQAAADIADVIIENIQHRNGGCFLMRPRPVAGAALTSEIKRPATETTLDKQTPVALSR